VRTPGRQHAADLEAVYEGLDAAEAACQRGWPDLRDAIAKARAVADALRFDPNFPRERLRAGPL